MRHRGARILCLVFVAVWFGVLVPGHPRGQIPVPGTGRCAAGGGDACGFCGQSGEEGPAAAGGRKAPPAPGRSCAVCQLVATLDLPQPIQLDAPPLGLALLPPIPQPVRVTPRPQHPTCRERGPPCA